MKPAIYFVFDIESVGLHGEGFAYGYVVVNQGGVEQETGFGHTWVDHCEGGDEGREWVRENCPWAVYAGVNRVLGELGVSPDAEPNQPEPEDLRTAFWDTWMRWREQGAVMVADCPWPVEARFLAACVNDDDSRTWQGPYPLVDIGSVRLAANMDPLATVGRLPNEEPAHNPLCDARQSARLFLEALHEGVSWHKAYARGRDDEAANSRAAFGVSGSAALDVLLERRKQIVRWGGHHDDSHDLEELASAAAYLADPSTENLDGDEDDEDLGWAVRLRAKYKADRRKQLVIAAALAIAEIERLDRAAPR